MSSPDTSSWVKCGQFTYNSKDVLGKGSFAEVFKGHRVSDGVEVAVKCIHKSRLRKSSNARLLESEISIMRGIKHRHIIELYDCISVDPYMCLVMEYCDGGELSGYIAEHAPLPEHEIAVILRQLADALLYLRKKEIVHRDLKPQNILLKRNVDEQPCLKIADFGFARQLVDEDMAATFCGSPLYMAPEVLEGDSYNAKADLWSLGTIIYQTLTGQVPFKAPSMKALKNLLRKTGAKASYPVDASPAIVDLLQGLLQPDAAKRMDFDEVLNHPFLTGAPLRSSANRTGGAVRSPSPLDPTLFGSSDTEVIPMPLPSGKNQEVSSSLNSFVEVDKPSVELTILAEAIREGRARLVKPGTFHPTEIAAFVTTVQNVSKPAAAIMSVAQARISLQREDAVMPTDDYAAAAAVVEELPTSPKTPCNSKEQAEALVLLQRALGIFRSGMSQLHSALEQKRGIAYTLEGSRELQFLSKKFNDCLAKIERLKYSIRGCEHLTIASAEELMYEHAIRLCRDAAADEALHNIETSEVLYSRAVTLFRLLIESCQEPEDGRVLRRYLQATERRLQIVAQQSQARAQAVAAAQNTGGGLARPGAQVPLSGPPPATRRTPPLHPPHQQLQQVQTPYGSSAMSPPQGPFAQPPHTPSGHPHQGSYPPQQQQQQHQQPQSYASPPQHTPPHQHAPYPQGHHQHQTTPGVPMPPPHTPYGSNQPSPYVGPGAAGWRPESPAAHHVGSGGSGGSGGGIVVPSSAGVPIPGSEGRHAMGMPHSPYSPQSFPGSYPSSYQEGASFPGGSAGSFTDNPLMQRSRTSSSASRVFCVSCGIPFGETHRFCQNCGAPRPNPHQDSPHQRNPLIHQTSDPGPGPHGSFSGPQHSQLGSQHQSQHGSQHQSQHQDWSQYSGGASWHSQHSNSGSYLQSSRSFSDQQRDAFA